MAIWKEKATENRAARNAEGRDRSSSMGGGQQQQRTGDGQQQGEATERERVKKRGLMFEALT
ncbi:putative presenilin-2 [Sesbania bispinosa]|nr:putative presenilin-2 [Sesbania bispinosa]